MSGWLPASPSYRRAPLAFGLCLLAFLFAIEAKTAWYGPAAGFGGSIRAAKAQPMTSPEVVEHGVPKPDPTHPSAAFVFLSQAATPMFVGLSSRALGEVLPSRHPRPLNAGFSYSNLFRPPPAF
ncbi:MAG: hypothetical protein WCF30_11415 [Terracidiphilus sp.]